ncbi:ATP-dependent RNA helicase HrpA [Streptomyces sp. SCUT-3]|uniref:ATP-dependent RNA helicase HrpA n=1 Tax=Streptomyces sp. SCUT-3 TaxID=2684469 RepID=UPI000CC7CCBA|nr:ATP-dependent RNA helicase HrpA [Streptomyces sp. SCUT-3]PLW74249.1 ATP-dependent RNA helicase HrpA [Streptomyces sp. DJ]QMV22318.1 ATP-dependent RNA helicase HrpA [Streptomyces sp. SCUT-3]
MSSSSTAPAIADLLARLPELTLRDERRLRRRLDGARRIRDAESRTKVLAEITADLDQAELRVEQRRAAVPRITYPEALPVSRKKDDILEAIRDNQVVIVAGETGSGKTTQIPKICLELGRGVRGLIGHTQPRRIAARTVADRVAEELGTPLGEAVGWKVRFTDHVGASTLVKLMTDGILLAELQQDRMLQQYDTIIIDEAHERSLNIDFILGYLKQLLPKRPDLKVVITSATIDPERFSRHFSDAPIIEVSGRTYPVEVRYRPVVDPDAEDPDPDRDQITAICDAVDELGREGPGDILVFLSGEREIRDTADALNKKNLRFTEVLPLYARLSSAEQHRVFQQHTGRRIVLATNVAETSLTVPGIRYVIDPGTARISRYSHRTKVQRLPIEPVSQASANQRKGRCGRTSDGICIRLYSEEDFLSRPEFTDPEILRTNLASVILQMTAAGLGDVSAFPFIDPPDPRNIKDGVQLLEELGALDPKEKDPRKRLTPLGRKLSQLPVDPRLARMVLEADRNGCVREVMVIAAALSIQDPRERPADKQQAADEKHRRFADENSDFTAFLNLWKYLKEQQRELSSSAFRRMCRNEYLNFLRVREWQDIFQQLRQVARTMGIHLDDKDADPQRVTLSLLAGLLSHIGLKDTDKNEYLGARSAKFAVFPGSALFKKPPRWIMSAELVETSRLWARVNARIEPEWIEPLAGHLLKRTYSEPHWELKQAAVMAYERVTLYGVPIVAQRKVNYGRIDPEVSRELFIRHALVEGDWRTHHKFFHENRRLLGEVEELEHRARRRDILVDDETLFDFYDERIPEHVVSGAHFDSWWKKARHDSPDLLSFEKSMLINEKAGGVAAADYPDFWVQGPHRLRLTYQFEPGADADGVTVHVPLAILNQVVPDGFDWQIPGLREQLVTELIRSLPKPVRRNFVPAPNYAKAFLQRVEPGDEPLTAALGRELQRMAGFPVPEDVWDWAKVPDHLRPTFRIVDDRRRRLAEDKDLEALKLRLRAKTTAAISEAAAEKGIERGGLTSWTVGTLPRTFEQRTRGNTMKAYPALVDEGSSVAVRLFDTEAEQRAAMWAGTRRLILLGAPSPAKFVQSKLDNRSKLTLGHNPHGSVQALLDDCVSAAADRLMAAAGGPAWDEPGFTALSGRVRAGLPDATAETVAVVLEVLKAAHAVEDRLRSTNSPVLLPALADLREQLAALIPPGFVTATGRRRLPSLVRYLVAMDRRLQKLPGDPARDRARMEKVHAMQDAHRELLDRLPKGRPVPEEVREIRWMVEELRVSYFAHALGTPQPVSDKRILKAIERAGG